MDPIHASTKVEMTEIGEVGTKKNEQQGEKESREKVFRKRVLFEEHVILRLTIVEEDLTGKKMRPGLLQKARKRRSRITTSRRMERKETRKVTALKEMPFKNISIHHNTLCIHLYL